MKFITEGWPKSGQVLVENLSVTYLQSNDSYEAGEDGQQLILEIRDSGGGPFIHMKTDGWSIDTAEDLVEVINHFKEKIK